MQSNYDATIGSNRIVPLRRFDPSFSHVILPSYYSISLFLKLGATVRQSFFLLVIDSSFKQVRIVYRMKPQT